jgi:5-(carboxyamino)imidazole ribonucleotide mutase
MTNAKNSKSSNKSKKALISIVMGSQSDYETLKHSEQIMIDFSIPYEIQVVSAHRTPTLMYKFALEAMKRGLKVIIAGAGGSAHLPGMISSLTTIPVLGVPVESKALKGLDSLLSIVQMPAGIPTATFAVGNAGATNAGLFALEILSLEDKLLAKKIEHYRLQNSKKALAGNKIVQTRYRAK